MKNSYFLKAGLAWLVACMISTGIFAQVAVVGTLKNGKPVVTNLVEATTVLKGGLSASATVTDIYIDQEPESGKYFLIGRIGNASISGKAVELKLEAGVFKAVGGPGLEITCNGVRCSECIPVVAKWKVRCECKDNPLKPDYECNMTSKVIITAW